MNTTGRLLSKELYEKSGWLGSGYYWCLVQTNPSELWQVKRAPESPLKNYPAYELGYLVRKLPYCELFHFANGKYKATWQGSNAIVSGVSHHSPENAVARLAVKMLEEQILQSVYMGGVSPAPTQQTK